MCFVLRAYPYPFDILISFAQTEQQFKEELDSREFQSDGNHTLTSSHRGTFYINDINQSYIRMPVIPKTPENFGELAHEIFHAVTYIMDRIGAKMKLKTSDESYAYLIQYITAEIYRKCQI